LRHLIVQLPGIAGSVLTGRNDRSTWDVSPTDLIPVVLDPDRLSDPDARPDRLIDSMTVVPGLVALPGYDRMVRNLRTWFGAEVKVVDHRPGQPVPPDVDVLRIPYDFRRSISAAAETVDRAVAETEGAARGVIVVAHSMGGLVARYWIGALGGWRNCVALITLGTPYRGAPRALDLLVNGAGMPGLRHPGLTRVLREWPSVHELVPRYPAVWTENGVLEPVDLPASCVRPFGTADAGDRLTRRMREAEQVRTDLERAWSEIPREHRPKLVPYFGGGHRTPNRAGLVNNRLKTTKDDPEWRPNIGWRGDGTVPAVSAIPTDLGDNQELWRAVTDKHGPMSGTPSVRGLLMSLLGDRLPTRGGSTPDRPWIGWDLDDVVPAHNETPLEVEVLGDVDTAGDSAMIRITPEIPTPSRPPVSEPMTVRDRRWQAVAPPLPPGTYSVSVQVENVHHGSSVYGQIPLVVVEPDEGWETISE
jgi:hypothetical protein